MIIRVKFLSLAVAFFLWKNSTNVGVKLGSGINLLSFLDTAMIKFRGLIEFVFLSPGT